MASSRNSTEKLTTLYFVVFDNNKRVCECIIEQGSIFQAFFFLYEPVTLVEVLGFIIFYREFQLKLIQIVLLSNSC